MAEPASAIFISYASVNREFADRLANDLTTHDLIVWIDRSKLRGGEQWTQEIERAIDVCQVMLVILSPAALESRYVRAEYDYAFAHGKRIIPLFYQSCDPPFPLQSLHGIDFTRQYDEHFATLLDRLQHPLDDQGTPSVEPHRMRPLWVIGLATMLLLVSLGTLFIFHSHGSSRHQDPPQLTATTGAGDTATASASASATDKASPSSHSPTSPSSPGPGTTAPATQTRKTPAPTSPSQPGATDTPTSTPKPKPTPTITPTPTSTRSPQ